MNFTDELRQNYNPNDNIKDEMISSRVRNIVWAVCTSCSEVSSSKRELSGYYQTGYDDAGRIIKDCKYPTVFIYDTNNEKLKNAIKHFRGSLVTWGQDAPTKFVEGIKTELVNKGFVNPIVKAIESEQSFTVSEGFILTKKKTLPGFIIYVEVHW